MAQRMEIGNRRQPTDTVKPEESAAAAAVEPKTRKKVEKKQTAESRRP